MIAQNVFVGAGGSLKIADFGLARQLDSADALWARDWAGTPGYWAPEIGRAVGEEDKSKREPHGLNADVWSMGVMLRELASILGQSKDAAGLANFACVEHRESRPSAVQLKEKVRELSTDTREAVRVAESLSAVGDDYEGDKFEDGSEFEGEDEHYEDDFEPYTSHRLSHATLPAGIPRKSVSIYADGGFIADARRSRQRAGMAVDSESLYQF